jgi:hypothetical protein
MRTPLFAAEESLEESADRAVFVRTTDFLAFSEQF